MQRNLCLFALLSLAASTSGCSEPDQPKAYPTSGVVRFNGKPMKGGGAISFVPLSPLAGKAAGAEIKEDGTFVMSTYEEGDGSIAGKFRVMVLQSASKEAEIVAPDGGGEPKMSSGPIETVPREDRIPFIYADSAQSPITVEVKAQESNDLSIDLKRT